MTEYPADALGGRIGRREVLLALALAVLGLPLAAETPPDVQVRDRTKVYVGNPDRFTKPAVVVATKVYVEITEYQEVRRRKLDRNDPDYYVLMEKASRKFHAALEEAAKAGPYDLVAETGAVTRTEGTLPDLTDAAIEEVRKIQQKP